jgi:glycosyltransferase involved in cell wall biosynthesis
VKRVLMVAFHFPPLAGSSGIQRTLRFVQHLPRRGWQALVLSASPRAYERTGTDLLAEVPPSTVVRRAFALDTARHLSIGGRYLDAMARPDRWISWKWDAVRTGMQMIRDFKPEVLWSTYPIATAHLVGAELQRRSGLPWVADFRDPMAQEGYPPDPVTWRRFEAIEKLAVNQASRLMFTTPGALRRYRERYPEAADRMELLENGYDESTFAAIEREHPEPAPLIPGVLTLLHSGIVYPDERDPTQLFAALGQLRKAGLANGRLKVRFRAALHDDLLLALAREHAVADLIEVCPPIDYREALREMLRADGLLVMQAANCNQQVPAKIYEYLRAGKPVLCLTHPTGDTASVLRAVGIDSIARLDSAREIAALIDRWLAGSRSQQTVATPAAVLRASRLGRAEALADRFDSIASAATRQVRGATTSAGTA